MVGEGGAVSEERAYIATKPCGCLSMAVMERDRLAAGMVKRAIAEGFVVDRVLPADVPPGRCTTHKKPAAQGVLL